MTGKVRLYESRDREAVRYICCETGFMGEPMERFMDGREFFADLWASYWTDYEPEHVWVAEVDGKVIGYIFGGLDTHKQEAVTMKKIGPKIMFKFFTTDCFWSRKTLKYVRQVYRSYRRGELDMPKLSREYPAHLHTNIIDGYRGKGLGKKLMLCWLDHLKEHGVQNLHLVTTTRNVIAVPFYKHMGFKALFEMPITMYDHVVDEPIAILGMGMKF